MNYSTAFLFPCSHRRFSDGVDGFRLEEAEAAEIKNFPSISDLRELIRKRDLARAIEVRGAWRWELEGCFDIGMDARDSCLGGLLGVRPSWGLKQFVSIAIEARYNTPVSCTSFFFLR